MRSRNTRTYETLKAIGFKHVQCKNYRTLFKEAQWHCSCNDYVPKNNVQNSKTGRHTDLLPIKTKINLTDGNHGGRHVKVGKGEGRFRGPVGKGSKLDLLLLVNIELVFCSKPRISVNYHIPMNSETFRE
jgi:hypothetical protein